jgi:hypothetical protein
VLQLDVLRFLPLHNNNIFILSGATRMFFSSLLLIFFYLNAFAEKAREGNMKSCGKLFAYFEVMLRAAIRIRERKKMVN